MGSSSASTKLIHGGLRYLEMYDFALVRKALIDRGFAIFALDAQAHGDRILVEQTIDGPETRSYYEGVHALVERRARQLAARHPHLANVFEEYIERQRHEIKLLTGPVVGALWVLERAPSAI